MTPEGEKQIIELLQKLVARVETLTMVTQSSAGRGTGGHSVVYLDENGPVVRGSGGGGGVSR